MKEAEALDKVALIDLEASGLGDRSFPIEVGWAIGEASPAAFLIKPHESWSLTAWDEGAEQLHGLSFETLQNTGTDPGLVCKKLNDVLAGRIVYSDAPDWDGFWLYRLHSAAGMRQTFSLANFADLMPPITLTEKMALVAAANTRAAHAHRATEDIRHMQALLALAWTRH